MPELPDVEIYKRETEKALRRRIDEFDIRDRDFVQVSRRDFSRQIIGKELQQVRRKGKYLFLETGDRSSVVLHFGMTGLLKFAPEEEAAPDYVKLTFVLDNRNRLHYVSKRKLGRVEITDDAARYADEQDLGTDAFHMEEDEFREKTKAGRAMIKSFLMDQSSISGSGLSRCKGKIRNIRISGRTAYYCPSCQKK